MNALDANTTRKVLYGTLTMLNLNDSSGNLSEAYTCCLHAFNWNECDYAIERLLRKAISEQRDTPVVLALDVNNVVQEVILLKYDRRAMGWDEVEEGPQPSTPARKEFIADADKTWKWDQWDPTRRAY